VNQTASYLLRNARSIILGCGLLAIALVLMFPLWRVEDEHRISFFLTPPKHERASHPYDALFGVKVPPLEIDSGLTAYEVMIIAIGTTALWILAGIWVKK
jgi:hypothetical protein